jgi:hypothetical protein
VSLTRTDVSEERVAFIFRVEKSASEKIVSSWPVSQLIKLFFVCGFFTLKKEATQDLHGVTTKKSAFSIVAAVKTSNPT